MALGRRPGGGGAALTIAVAAAAALAGVPSASSQRNISVLWCGNSLTQVHNLPGVFDALTRSLNSVIRSSSSLSAEGGAQFRQHAVPPSDYGHSSTGLRTIATIRRGGWSFVVLQDQSGSWFNLRPCTALGQSDCLDHYGEWNETLGAYVPYPSILVDEARAVGAMPVFYMNWRQKYAPMSPTTQAEVSAAFTNVAGLTNAMCAPFGNAMLLNYERLGNATYNGDEIHPSLLTQYTNACVMYATVTGQSPVGLGDAGTGLAQSLNLTALQVAAWTAYTQYRAAQLAACNASRCVQFVNSSGAFLPMPTHAPTPTPGGGPPSVPTVRRCTFPRNVSAVRLAGSQIIPNVTTSQPPLAAALSSVCSASWRLCYSSATDGWSGDAFRAGCTNRGPTLVVVRSTAGRVFGALAPVSWGGPTRQPGLGGWLFRVPPGGGAVQFVNLTVPGDPSSAVMRNDATTCLWMGKWTDLYLGPDCSAGLVTAYSGSTTCYVGASCVNDCESDCYNSTWLAGSTMFNSSLVEVFYSPELDLNTMCRAPNFRCPNGVCLRPSMVCDSYADCIDGADESSCSAGAPTAAPTETAAPVTVGPTTVAPTTLAPSTVAPTLQSPTSPGAPPPPTTVAPVTFSPTTVAPTTTAPITVPPATLAPTGTFYPTLQPPSTPPRTVAPTYSPTPRPPPTTAWPTTSEPSARPTWYPTATLAPTDSSAPTTAAPVTPAPTLSGPTQLVVSFPGGLGALTAADRSVLASAVAVVVARAAGVDASAVAVVLVGDESAANFTAVASFTPQISAARVQAAAFAIDTSPFSVRLSGGVSLRPTSATVEQVPAPVSSGGGGSSSSGGLMIVVAAAIGACIAVAVVGVLICKWRRKGAVALTAPGPNVRYNQFSNSAFGVDADSEDDDHIVADETDA